MDNKIIISKKDLINKCKSRLTTQVRIYYQVGEEAPIIYPIRTIKRILLNNKQTKDDWKEYIEDLINNISIYYSDNSGKNCYKEIRLKEIKDIEIINKKAYITIDENSKKYLVYSKINHTDYSPVNNLYKKDRKVYTKANDVYIKREWTEYIEMKNVNGIDDIHIDHEIPMQKIMKDMYKELKALQQLNKKIIDYSKEYQIKINVKSDKVWCKKEAIDHYNLSDKNIKDLMGDIKRIKMRLNLMDKQTNLIKSNSI